MKAAVIFLVCSSWLFRMACADETRNVMDNRLPPEAVKSLSTGKDFILYSLDPGPKGVGPSPPLGPEGSLNGVKILGSLHLTDPKSLAIARSAVNDAIRAADYNLVMMCFLPRHALRVTANGEFYAFMICYECQQLRLYRRGVWLGVIGIPNAPDSLNNLLSTSRIPLAARPSRK